VAWIVWSGIGVVLAALLGVSWWYDRDARRRGASPLRGGQMARARRQRVLDTARLETKVLDKGVTPRSTEGVRRMWDGG
jgi:hypothetical protein